MMARTTRTMTPGTESERPNDPNANGHLAHYEAPTRTSWTARKFRLAFLPHSGRLDFMPESVFNMSRASMFTIALAFSISSLVSTLCAHPSRRINVPLCYSYLLLLLE